MEREIEQLIEDYRRRVFNIGKELTSDTILSLEKADRLETKKGCYQTFIAELEKIKTIFQYPLIPEQVGGTHYNQAIQPIEYIHANSLDFMEGNVVKYITRHRAKGGKEDIKKAIHYLEMILKYNYENKETDNS